MTKSSISNQLGTLRRAGIVKCKKIGKEVFYALDDDHIVVETNKIKFYKI